MTEIGRNVTMEHDHGVIIRVSKVIEITEDGYREILKSNPDSVIIGEKTENGQTIKEVRQIPGKGEIILELKGRYRYYRTFEGVEFDD